MSTRVTLAALAAFAFGCASGGGGNNLPPVPVYTSTDDVPCEYEVIETVRGSSSRSPRGSAALQRIRDNVLGRAGAGIGADAVIAAPPEPGRAMRERPPPSTPRLLRFSGEAIRFIPGTCGGTE